MTDHGPDMIFQGGIRRDALCRRPKVLASSLAFTSVPIRTLETGCEIYVHFLDHTTAEVRLNNYVYWLEKQQFAATNAHSHRKQDETL